MRGRTLIQALVTPNNVQTHLDAPQAALLPLASLLQHSRHGVYQVAGCGACLKKKKSGLFRVVYRGLYEAGNSSPVQAVVGEHGVVHTQYA